MSIEEYQLKGAFLILLKNIVERKPYENNLLVKKYKPKVFYNEDDSITIDWGYFVVGKGVFAECYRFIIDIASDLKIITYCAYCNTQKWDGGFRLDSFTTEGIPLFILL